MAATSPQAKARKAARRTLRCTAGAIRATIVKQPTPEDKRRAVAELLEEIAALPVEWQPTDRDRKRARRQRQGTKRFKSRPAFKRLDRAGRSLRRAEHAITAARYQAGGEEDGFIASYVADRLLREMATYNRTHRYDPTAEFYWLRGMVVKLGRQYGYQVDGKDIDRCMVRWVNRANDKDSFTFLLNKDYSFPLSQAIFKRKHTYRIGLYHDVTDLAAYGKHIKQLSQGGYRDKQGNFKFHKMTAINLTPQARLDQRYLRLKEKLNGNAKKTTPVELAALRVLVR